MEQRNRPKGTPLPAEEREALAGLVAEVGEREAGDVVGLHRLTMARALAGLPVAAGSAALIREKLAARRAAGPTESKAS